jgi:putative NIF3 family GTP cyclohydrolase 1 type 2
MSIRKINSDSNFISRKTFFVNSIKAAGILLFSPLVNKASGVFRLEDKITVGQIIDRFIQTVPTGIIANTVDTLKAGDRTLNVMGVVTSMFATVEVIRKTIDLGANFIIVHEPTFYSHTDATDWLKEDDVYQYKAELLKEHNIAVWRNHDYVHSLAPDQVTHSVLSKLNWLKYSDRQTPELLNMPSISLKNLTLHIKTKLGIEMIRYIGNAEEVCSRVLFIPGAAGGSTQIKAISEFKPDLLICGEIQEWETAEYVRDARAKGDKLSLLVLGHIASEDEGSLYMLNWIKDNFPSLNSNRLKAKPSLSFM